MATDAAAFKNRIRLEETSSASTQKGELRVNSSGNLLLHNGSSEAALVRTDQLSSLVYDNSTSGLSATDPKAAIDEIDGDLDTHIADTAAHGVSGDVLGTTDTQTLTNKTIDADNNTLSNLAHGAEVDDPSSGVHGVTGDIVGTTDTQTLSNKTLTSPVLNTGVSGTAILDEDDMSSNSDTQLATQQSIKAYVDASAGGILNVSTKTASTYTATTDDDLILLDTTSNDITVTLPAASGNAGKVLRFLMINATNEGIIDGNSSETIGGSTTKTLYNLNQRLVIVCDGSNWQILENQSPKGGVHARCGTAQTISNSAWITRTTWTEDKDEFSEFNASTGVFTAARTGWYSMNFSSDFANNGTGQRIIALWRNDTTERIAYGELFPSSSFSTTCECNVVYFLEKGETIYPKVLQTSGGNLDTNANIVTNYLSIVFVGDPE